MFDQPFTSHGTWQDDAVSPDATTASGGTTYGTDGYPPAGKGSGGYVGFAPGSTVNVPGRHLVRQPGQRPGQPRGGEPGAARRSETVPQRRARRVEQRSCAASQINGGTEAERTTFYTALYHSLLHPNVFSDVNGEYRGLDQQGPTRRRAAARAVRQLLRLGRLPLAAPARGACWSPKIASDIAQSLLNQADQNGGVWDRWTHNTGGTP